MGEPKQVKMRAVDVVPFLYGIWCTIEGGEPFVNDIVYERWSEDTPGEIIFGLDSHNSDFRMADEEIEVVPLELNEYRKGNRERYIAEHAAFKAKCPSADGIKLRVAIKAAIKVLQDALKESP